MALLLTVLFSSPALGQRAAADPVHLSADTSTPTAIQHTLPPITLDVTPKPASPGTVVHLHVRVSDPRYTTLTLTIPCGSLLGAEPVGPEATILWSTDGCQPGGYSVTVHALPADPTDPSPAVSVGGGAVLAPPRSLPGTVPTTALPRPVPTPSPTVAPVPWVPYHDLHPLLAYYYAWWEPEKIAAGWPYTPVQHYPGWVRQLVNDPDLLREHILEAQAAGIDGFIVNRSVDLRTLLEVASGSDFRLSLQVDAETGDPTSEIQAFYQYLDSPLLVRYQGRPVLFFWRAGRLGDAFWSNLRAQVDPDHAVLWIADGDDFNILAGDVWDGISPYAIAWSPNPQSQLPAWAAKARAVAPAKLFIPPVSPGCDDHLARPTTCLQGRAEGAYYKATLDGARASRPAWAIVVSTFNEWLEATQIEPAAEYGDLYIQFTRQFSDSWRDGQSSEVVDRDSADASATASPQSGGE